MKKTTLIILALVATIGIREAVHARRIANTINYYKAELALLQDSRDDACADKVADAVKEMERKIIEIEDASDDAVSTCEILTAEAQEEAKKAYDKGFEACLAQF